MMDKPNHDPAQNMARWLSSEDVLKAIRFVADNRTDDASLATAFLIEQEILLMCEGAR